MHGWPLYFSTKNTILKAYDGCFMVIFEKVYETEFKAEFDKKKLTYEHRLIDDMVAGTAEVPRWLRVGLQDLRRRRAVGHGGAGLRLAWADDQRAAVAERQDGGERGGARHGDAALPAALEGQQTSTNPIASIFAWTRGFMTRDLAVLIGPDQKWLNTQDFLAKLDENLKTAMG